MNEWIVWALLLMAQNASFTWVSRARNSRSYWYHALAAVFANGVWILSMFFIVDKLKEARGHIGLMVCTGVVYTLFTVLGSVAMHYISINFLERGKRKVGA